MWWLDYFIALQKYFDIRRSCYARVECAVNSRTKKYYKETADSRPDGQLHLFSSGERVLCITDDDWSDLPAVKFYLNRTMLASPHSGYMEVTLFWHQSYIEKQFSMAAHILTIRFI